MAQRDGLVLALVFVFVPVCVLGVGPAGRIRGGGKVEALWARGPRRTVLERNGFSPREATSVAAWETGGADVVVTVVAVVGLSAVAGRTRRLLTTKGEGGERGRVVLVIDLRLGTGSVCFAVAGCDGDCLISGDSAVPELLGDNSGSMMGIVDTVTTGGSIGNHEGEGAR